ncbi:MAG: ATP-binding cassette domain-containing protein [Bacteroidota bacterium]|jgi:ABC-2 type transport system ATP-binding protein
MLVASHLRKEYAGVVAVDDVSLNVKRGEIFGLLGPNGAGKTTTIRMILNIISPDAGKVTVNGRPFEEATRNLFGYLPEERGLYRKSKLLNAIVYFATLRGISVGEAKRRAYEWLKRFDLLSHYDRRIEELSKGNQQKVQFIISVLHDPQLVILDEPFSGLDPVNQILLKDILLELRQQGKAIVFSTHMMEQAEKLCETICLINRGRVVLEGELSHVKQRFGKNTIHLEFEGDGSFLSGIPAVKQALLYENSAELELGEHARPGELLREIAQRISIRKFELHEPSLQAIFLKTVGIQGVVASGTASA